MAEQSSVELEPGWKQVLGDEFTKPYMQDLKAFLRQEKQAGETVYPPGPDIFRAFNETPFDQVKVVILGQDPYHGPDQAHGLCFSVQPGVRTPPSLINIFKEIERDLGIPAPDHGNLDAWARQGVLLLNAVLTVRAGQAASHQRQGWEEFTDQAIEHINREREGVVFFCGAATPRKRQADRPAAPLRAHRAAPVAALRPSRFPGLRALFPRQPVPSATRQGPHRLVPVNLRLTDPLRTLSA